MENNQNDQIKKDDVLENIDDEFKVEGKVQYEYTQEGGMINEHLVAHDVTLEGKLPKEYGDVDYKPISTTFFLAFGIQFARQGIIEDTYIASKIGEFKYYINPFQLVLENGEEGDSKYEIYIGTFDKQGAPSSFQYYSETKILPKEGSSYTRKLLVDLSLTCEVARYN